MTEASASSNSGSRHLRVACDVGGTFTDICVLDERTGTLRVAKVPSTADPIEGVFKGVEEAGIELGDVALFSHGTTLATNALITRNFPPAIMVTTRGFRDVIEIRRGTRDDLWDTYKELAAPYIRRRDRLVVSERVDYSGAVITPLDEDDAREIARTIRHRGITNIAVCFVNAFVNPQNERRMRDILLEEIPDAIVSTSSDVLPEIFEHERFSTTVANTVLAPVVGRYARDLESRLHDAGYVEDLLLLHSGGGVMTPKTCERFAARLAASGIAAGAIASRHIAKLCGYENAIGLDMGGTSTDVSLCDRGELRVTKDWYVQYGYPICFPSIEVLTIGAGGGSLAWIDDAGSLRNGPQSAGADPGPACYMRGGEQPTNTDANVVLGRLGDVLAGGAVTLDKEAAIQAIGEQVAKPLGLTLDEAASAIIRVANANMADAVRLISIRRGYDPRDFALVVFGGAGPLHGAALAKELAIPTVLVPPSPGVTSALGCLLVDIRHDISVMFLGRANELDPSEVESAFAELEAEGRERLAHESVPQDRMHLQRSIDMRYLGQWRSMAIPVGQSPTSLDEAIALFHEEHGREHNYRRDDAPVEVYRLSVTASGVTPHAELARHEQNTRPSEPFATRPVYFDELDQPVETPVFRRDDVGAGTVIDGPAVIEQLDSTIIVPPGVRAQVDPWLNIRMAIPEEAT